MKIKRSLALLTLGLALSASGLQPSLALPPVPNLTVITPENIAQLNPYAVFDSKETQLLLSIGFDANSHLIALFRDDATLELRDMETREPIVSHVVTSMGDIFADPIISSPSGRTAAVWLDQYPSAGILRIFNITTGRSKLISAVLTNAFSPFAMSWDDQFAAFFDVVSNPEEDSRQTIVLISLSSDRVIKNIYVQDTPNSDLVLLTSLFFSPDNHFLYAGTDEGKIVKWNISTEQKVETYPAPDGVSAGLAISPRGDLMAAADCVDWKTSGKLTICAQSKIVFWNVRTHKKLFEVVRSYEIPVVTFSPDGKSIAVYSPLDNNKISLWGVVADSVAKIEGPYIYLTRSLQ